MTISITIPYRDRYHLYRYGIGIEIVIDVEAVDVVAAYYVVDNLADVIPVLWNTRIEYVQYIVGKHPFGICYGYVVGGQGGSTLCLGAIGVYPRMQFHSALMALVYHPLQGVPVRRWRLSLNTCKEAAPRLELALVEGITLWTHLENDGVDTITLQFIKLLRQGSLHSRRGHTLELSVYTLYPRTPEFPFLGISRNEDE